MVRCSLQVVHLWHTGLLAHPLHPCLLAFLATSLHSRVSSVWPCRTPDASPYACLMCWWYIVVSLFPGNLGGILSSSFALSSCKFSVLPDIFIYLIRTQIESQKICPFISILTRGSPLFSVRVINSRRQLTRQLWPGQNLCVSHRFWPQRASWFSQS